MNVVFHALTAMAISSVVAARPTAPRTVFEASSFRWMGVGFVAAMFAHGVLDVIPHQYPLRGAVDVTIAMVMYVLFQTLIQRRLWLVWTGCFVGCVFPDLVDLGPPLLNRHLGMHLPTFAIFPFHWPAYSGSIFDRSRVWLSVACHLFVVAGCVWTIFIGRRRFLRKGGIN